MTTDGHSKVLPLAQGQMFVNDIATSFDACLFTARKDQLKLEEQGQIERTYGAVRIATGFCKVVVLP